MNDRDPYAFVAAILPPLLGLGLIELYVARGVSFSTIVAGLIALTVLMTVIAALVDIVRANRERPRRRRRSRQR